MHLKTTNLSIKRVGSPILVFADLDIKQGENTLLLGPSGSGKTTLLSIIAGFLLPSSGSVSLNDQDFYKLKATERDCLRGQKMGFVFQTLHLLPTLTVLDNILLATKMAGLEVDTSRAENLLDQLGLSHKLFSKPHELSQGEQQRAAIARSLINNPEIIIADEPTSALDDRNAEIIINLLQEQAIKQNASLLISTHDHRITDRFSNKVLLDVQQKVAA